MGASWRTDRACRKRDNMSIHQDLVVLSAFCVPSLFYFDLNLHLLCLLLAQRRYFRKILTNIADSGQQRNVGGDRNRQKITSQEKRLIGLAFMTTILLLLSMALSAILAISTKDWHTTTKLSLQCERETMTTHDFDTYEIKTGLKAGDPVCSGTVSNNFNNKDGDDRAQCKKDCIYRQENCAPLPSLLVCHIFDMRTYCPLCT